MAQSGLTAGNRPAPINQEDVMLYFICFPQGGFVSDDNGACTFNVRHAKPFNSFESADDFARDLVKGCTAYAILANCVGAA